MQMTQATLRDLLSLHGVVFEATPFGLISKGSPPTCCGPLQKAPQSTILIATHMGVLPFRGPPQNSCWFPAKTTNKVPPKKDTPVSVIAIEAILGGEGVPKIRREGQPPMPAELNLQWLCEFRGSGRGSGGPNWMTVWRPRTGIGPLREAMRPLNIALFARHKTNKTSKCNNE